jgi:hypothetical protein
VLGGEEAEGFKVQSRRGNTSVSDSLAFARALCEKYDLSFEELVEKAGSISFSKSVAFLKEYNSGMDAVEIRERLEKEMGHLVKIGPQITFLSRERKGKRKEAKKREVEQLDSAKKLLDEIQNNQPLGV